MVMVLCQFRTLKQPRFLLKIKNVLLQIESMMMVGSTGVVPDQ